MLGLRIAQTTTLPSVAVAFQGPHLCLWHGQACVPAGTTNCVHSGTGKSIFSCFSDVVQADVDAEMKWHIRCKLFMNENTAWPVRNTQNQALMHLKNAEPNPVMLPLSIVSILIGILLKLL